MKYNLFILLPNISDEEIKTAEKSIQETISKSGAQIETSKEYGKRKLSYTVKKARHGFYMNYVINLDKKDINNLKKELKLSSDVLRFELSRYKKSKVLKKARSDAKAEPKQKNKMVVY